MLTQYYETDAKGHSRFYCTLTETATGKLIRRMEGGQQVWWLPTSDKLYRTETRAGQRVLLAIDRLRGLKP